MTWASPQVKMECQSMFSHLKHFHELLSPRQMDLSKILVYTAARVLTLNLPSFASLAFYLLLRRNAKANQVQVIVHDEEGNPVQGMYYSNA